MAGKCPVSAVDIFNRTVGLNPALRRPYVEPPMMSPTRPTVAYKGAEPFDNPWPQLRDIPSWCKTPVEVPRTPPRLVRSSMAGEADCEEEDPWPEESLLIKPGTGRYPRAYSPPSPGIHPRSWLFGRQVTHDYHPPNWLWAREASVPDVNVPEWLWDRDESIYCPPEPPKRMPPPPEYYAPSWLYGRQVSHDYHPKSWLYGRQESHDYHPKSWLYGRQKSHDYHPKSWLYGRQKSHDYHPKSWLYGRQVSHDYHPPTWLWGVQRSPPDVPMPHWLWHQSDSNRCSTPQDTQDYHPPTWLWAAEPSPADVSMPDWLWDEGACNPRPMYGGVSKSLYDPSKYSPISRRSPGQPTRPPKPTHEQKFQEKMEKLRRERNQRKAEAANRPQAPPPSRAPWQYCYKP